MSRATDHGDRRTRSGTTTASEARERLGRDRDGTSSSETLAAGDYTLHLGGPGPATREGRPFNHAAARPPVRRRRDRDVAELDGDSTAEPAKSPFEGRSNGPASPWWTGSGELWGSVSTDPRHLHDQRHRSGDYRVMFWDCDRSRIHLCDRLIGVRPGSKRTTSSSRRPTRMPVRVRRVGSRSSAPSTSRRSGRDGTRADLASRRAPPRGVRR